MSIMDKLETIFSPDSTMVKNGEAATAVTVTASRPEVAGVKTTTVMPSKDASGKQSVNPPSNPKTKDRKTIKNRKGVPEAEAEAEAPLTEAEKRDRDKFEETIRAGDDSDLDRNKALRAMRERRLYRESHRSFSEYCRDKWDLSEQRASQLIQWDEEIEMLADKIDEKLIPKSERAIRELRRALDKNKEEVLKLASEKSNGGRPNSTTIAAARIELEGNVEKKVKDKGVKVQAAVKAVKIVLSFLEDSDFDELTPEEIDELRELLEKIADGGAEKLTDTEA